MAIEYERRFLVRDVNDIADLDLGAGHELIVQGYLASKDGATLRIRRRLVMHGANERLLAEAKPELEYKGPRQDNSREEEQWQVNEHMAPKLIALAAGLIQKRRYAHVSRFGIWDVDVFMFANSGLVIAELETETPVADFIKPNWCSIDVGGIRAFDNEQLASHPISQWPTAQLDEYGLRYTGDDSR